MQNFEERLRHLSAEQRQLVEALFFKSAGSEKDLTVSNVAPRNPTEEKLAKVWAEVLGRSALGVYDNFFEAGGDSIQCIQIVAKCNRVGLKTTPNDLFDHPTVASLAEHLGQKKLWSQMTVDAIGNVPLTPIQRWYFEQRFVEPNYWNQAVFLEVDRSVDIDMLQKGLQALLIHHDSLRLRFSISAETVDQMCSGPEQLSFAVHDLSEHIDRDASMASLISEQHRSLNLANGPVFSAAVFYDTAAPRKLLLVAHHLTVDVVSFRILIEDLRLYCSQVLRGEYPQLPPKTNSFREWALKWTASALDTRWKPSTEFWTAAAKDTVSPLPVDFPSGSNTEESAATVSYQLSIEATTSLLRLAPMLHGVQMQDILLAALLRTFHKWASLDELVIDMEGHGRDVDLEGLDISRTVGWFTSMFPIRLKAEPVYGFAQSARAIKDQLAAVPDRGTSFGLLRYCAGTDVALAWEKVPPRDILFNYLGQFDITKQDNKLLSISINASQPLYGISNQRPHKLQIYGGILRGALQMNLTFSRTLHREATIKSFADEMKTELNLFASQLSSNKLASLEGAAVNAEDLSREDLMRILSAHS